MEGLQGRRPDGPRTPDVGPMAREDLLDSLDDQVRRTVEAGAQLRTGGQRLEGKGWFYAPTVLTGVAARHGRLRRGDLRPGGGGDPGADADARGRAGQPLPVRPRRQRLDARRRRGEDLAAEIEAGSVFVNGIVKSDPRLPFGGVKRSRLRPRALGGGDPRVREHQDGVDQVNPHP